MHASGIRGGFRNARFQFGELADNVARFSESLARAVGWFLVMHASGIRGGFRNARFQFGELADNVARFSESLARAAENRFLVMYASRRRAVFVTPDSNSENWPTMLRLSH